MKLLTITISLLFCIGCWGQFSTPRITQPDTMVLPNYKNCPMYGYLQPHIYVAVVPDTVVWDKEVKQYPWTEGRNDLYGPPISDNKRRQLRNLLINENHQIKSLKQLKKEIEKISKLITL